MSFYNVQGLSSSPVLEDKKYHQTSKQNYCYRCKGTRRCTFKESVEFWNSRCIKYNYMYTEVCHQCKPGLWQAPNPIRNFQHKIILFAGIWPAWEGLVIDVIGRISVLSQIVLWYWPIKLVMWPILAFLIGQLQRRVKFFILRWVFI